MLTITPFTTMGLLGFMKKSDDLKDSKLTSQEILIAKADALFDASEYKQIYELLINYKVRKDGDKKNIYIIE